MFATDPFDSWPQMYHSTVASVVDAHIKSLQDTTTLPLECSATDYSSVIKPTAALRNLAQTLPPWKDAEKLQKLSEMDIGPVLLEYVRIYECALSERRNTLDIQILKDFANNSSSSSANGLSMERDDMNTKDTEERLKIAKEIAVARPALDRTLMIIGGEDRLHPLSIDIECLKRTSLDIRNILGLVSQASACLPRIRDARGSMQDIPNP